MTFRQGQSPTEVYMKEFNMTANDAAKAVQADIVKKFGFLK